MAQPRLSNKSAREFHKIAKSYGFELVRQGKHLTYRKPGCDPLVVSSTPSDGRAHKNNMARLRRMARAA